LRRSDAPNQVRWRDGVREIAARGRSKRPPTFFGDKPGLKLDKEEEDMPDEESRFSLRSSRQACEGTGSHLADDRTPGL